MKILFPRNIEKWFLAWLTFTRGPITVSIVQLFILAVWWALMLAIFNNLTKQWFTKLSAFVFSSPALGVAAIIAFFKISELTLIPFFSKIIRTYFLDTTKKFQVNFPKPHIVDILVKKNQHKEKIEEIKQKTTPINEILLEKIKKESLF